MTKTLIRTAKEKEGAYLVFNAPMTDNIRGVLISKYGNDIEIFNDVFAKGGIPSVLA
jgi:hypothetical protein